MPNLQLYTAICGSTAYGLNTEKSDIDIKGVFLAPKDDYFGINDPKNHWQKNWKDDPKQPENKEEEHFELRKFIKLALKNNPTILEMLWCPEITTHNYFNPLILHRNRFLSKKIFLTYTGYAKAQAGRIFKKLESDHHRANKLSSHLIRLLIACDSALRNQEIMVNVGDNKELIMDIKQGKMPIVKLEKLYISLLTKCQQSVIMSELPENPDFDFINESVKYIYGRYLSE